jgi:hypothetical protein
MLANAADASCKIFPALQGKNASARVGGKPVPAVRSVGEVQRDHQATLFAKAEHPNYYTLVYTYDTKQELAIHSEDGPPVRPFGLLFPPHRSLEIALRAMESRGDGQLGDELGDEQLFSLIDVGDGTDQRVRKIVVQGARLVVSTTTTTSRVLKKPTPFFPFLLYYGKESEHRFASPFVRVPGDNIRTVENYNWV